MNFSSQNAGGYRNLEHFLWGVYSYGWGDAQRLRLNPVGGVGTLQVGLCTWSASADSYALIEEIVAYIMSTDNGVNTLLATLPVVEARDVYVYLPKKHWWKPRETEKRRQIFQLRSAEEALLEAHKWAERRIGLTEEQQILIESAIEVIKLRNQALRELGLTPEEEWDKRLAEGS